MFDNLAPALTALVGVILSALTSFYIATRQSKLEIQKLRSEYLHRYAGQVFEKRLTSYPRIVEHLVVFFHKVNLCIIKKDKQYEVQIADLNNLLQALLEWDTQNAILYSLELQTVFHNTYRNLYKITSKPDDELNRLITRDDFLLELRNDLFKFFLALKKDLGIYSFESPATITDFKSPDTVKAVRDLESISKPIDK